MSVKQCWLAATMFMGKCEKVDAHSGYQHLSKRTKVFKEFRKRMLVVWFAMQQS